MLQPKDIDWLNGYKNKTRIYAVYRRPTSDLGAHTDWKWGDGKGIPCKWKWKETWCSNIHIRQNGLQNKYCYKRQRTLHNDQGINPRRYNNYKYIYAPNIGTPNYIRQILTAIKGEIDSNTILVGDFNIQLSTMDKLSRQKINKETQTLNDTLDQMDLIDIYRALCAKAAEITLFSSAHETFSRLITCWARKWALVYLGKLKSYQVSFTTTMLWD